MTSFSKMKAVFPKTNKQRRTGAKALIWNLFMFHQTQLESNCIWFETFNCSCCFSLQIRKSWLSVKKKKNSRSWLLVSFQGFATLIAFCLILCPSEIEGCLEAGEKLWWWLVGLGTGGTHSGGCKPASLSPGLLWGGGKPGGLFSCFRSGPVTGRVRISKLSLCIIYHFWLITAPLSSRNQTLVIMVLF